MSTSTPLTYVPTTQVPLIFGGVVACGIPGDELTGPVYLPLYSTGSATMTFFVPSTTTTSVQVALCMKRQGNPAASVLVSLSRSGAVLAAASLPPTSVPSASPGWTAFVTLTPSSQLAPGYYSVTVASPASTATDYYLVYINLYTSFVDANATASYSPPPGVGGNSGSPVIWLKDQSGGDLTVFPFGVSGDASLVGNGTFIASSSYQINCLVPWLSDMQFILPPYGATFVLTDTTTGTVIGTAPASQYYNSHGVFGLLPLQFPGAVNIVAGHSYSISISESGNAGSTSAYLVLVRGSKINPPQAGPSGSAVYWIGELALSDFSKYRVLDYGDTTTTLQDGHGAIGGLDMVAARIVPSVTQTITQVRLKMSNSEGSLPVSGRYPSGTPVIISLYASNEHYVAPEFAAPAGGALASATVDSGILPLVGFWSATVNFQVTAGTPYWIVWSSPTATTSAYDCERCVSPFRNLALATTDGGSSWAFNGQGPTDLAFAAISSQEILGSPFDNTIHVPISGSTVVAQPFSLSAPGTVNSVYVQAMGGTVMAAIYPDDGTGTRPAISSSPLASGNFNTAFSYFYSGIIIPLSPSVQVQANVKYWIVFSSSQSSSDVRVATYWTRPVDPLVPAGFEVLVSINGGTWSIPGGTGVASCIFMVGVVPQGVVTQPLSTTLTLTATLD